MADEVKAAARFDGIEISLIRQINALATPLTINLGIGEPNVEPDDELHAMARAAATVKWSYSPNAGALSLRKRLSETVVKGYDPQDEICVTAGTQEALYALLQAYVEPGDEVLVPDPGFLAYPTLVQLAGGTVRPYRLDEQWDIDFDDLERQLSPRTKMMLVNSPSNPTGGVVKDETLQRIVRLAEDRGFLVVSDEVYREIWYDNPPPSMRGRSRNVIVVDGMSKSHAMTGLRLGWIAAHRDIMPVILRAHQYIATCASVFSQSLAERVFSSPEWNGRWLERVREQFGNQRRTALSAVRQSLHHDLVPEPAGAFYLFVPVPSCATVSLARSLALEAGVLVIPGVAFGSRGEGFMRISYAAPHEQLETGIELIGRYLDGEERQKAEGRSRSRETGNFPI